MIYKDPPPSSWHPLPNPHPPPPKPHPPPAHPEKTLPDAQKKEWRQALSRCPEDRMDRC